MKKLTSLLLIAGMFTFFACGPSADEKAKEQHIKDSIANAKVADSLKRVKEADSIAKAKKLADSLKNDSIQKAQAAPAPKKEEPKKKGGKK